MYSLNISRMMVYIDFSCFENIVNFRNIVHGHETIVTMMKINICLTKLDPPAY